MGGTEEGDGSPLSFVGIGFENEENSYPIASLLTTLCLYFIDVVSIELRLFPKNCK